MTQSSLVHLLDDRSLGGVTRFLEIFDSPELCALANSSLLSLDLKARLASKLDADVIVTHFSANWERLPYLLSLRLRNPRAKIIHIEHSYSDEWETLHVPNKLRFRLMLKTAYSIFDEIVAVSKRQRMWLCKIGSKKAANIRVINPYAPNAGLELIDPATFPNDEVITIGAYGRYHESKGFDRLVAAFKELPDRANLRLVLGGYGPDEQKLRALAGDSSKIEIGGQIDDVAAFLKECQIVAIPSRYEAFGMVATEAREAGRPIIVANVGGLPEQVGRSGTILVDNDIKSLTQAFVRLNRHSLGEMAIEAKKSVEGCRELRVGQWRSLLRQYLPESAVDKCRRVKRVAA